LIARASDAVGHTQSTSVSFSVSIQAPPDPDPQPTSTTGAYVPLYMYPGGTGWTHWQTVIDAKNAHPSVPFVASINPSSGVGSSKNTAFVTGITKLKAAGIIVIGYVYTDYGARDINVIKSEISKYKEWYSVDGIMFDEMSNKVGYESYYRSLTDYAKSIGMTFTKGNPGTDVPASFVGTVDNISMRETSGYPTISQLAGWHTNYDKKNWSFVSYGVTNLDQAFVSSASQYVGLMYITNDVLSNPYDTVPSYFPTLVATLDTSTSSSSSTTTTSTPTAQNVLTVKSADLAGNQITGMYTTIKLTSGFPILSSFTTLVFSGTSGSTYNVTVADYGDRTFDHWQDGSTNRTRSVTLNQDTTLTAYYKIGI